MSILDAFEDEQDSADRFRDRCGVVGVWGHPEAANLAYLAMYALQHRGQESAGIVAGDGEALRRSVGAGLVADVFTEARLAGLPGKVAIGHVRYGTAGDISTGDGIDPVRDAQPLFARCQAGPIAVAHNGNLVNAHALRSQLEERGSIFGTSIDTEVILHLVATSHGSLMERLQKALRQVRGAYSLTVTGDGRLYGVRDPSGVRPLIVGKLKARAANGDGSPTYVIASETCAFDLIDAEVVREVEPGEIVVIDERGITSARLDNPDGVPAASCIFEHVYFARPDSLVFGRFVHEARTLLGRELARESPVPADLVIPVPDSGVYAAMGYAHEAGIPLGMGFVRNHYVGRTFIEPEQRIRHFGVRLKLNPVRALLEGKRVVIVDDSIVRGTTSRKIVEMVRGAGAREVHLRISAPPTTHPCYYGIDTPNREELIAAKLNTVDEIRAFVGADTLAYLSRVGMHAAVRDLPVAEAKPLAVVGQGYCDACFSGEYPIPIGGHRARR